MNTKFSDFRTKFFENLEEKTGWGKEQLKKMFDDTYFEMSNENINESTNSHRCTKCGFELGSHYKGIVCLKCLGLLKEE